MQTTAIIEKTLGAGIEVDESLNQINVILSSSDMSIGLGKYYYDVELTNNDNKKQTIILGILIIGYDVSRQCLRVLYVRQARLTKT